MIQYDKELFSRIASSYDYSPEEMKELLASVFCKAIVEHEINAWANILGIKTKKDLPKIELEPKKPKEPLKKFFVGFIGYCFDRNGYSGLNRIHYAVREAYNVFESYDDGFIKKSLKVKKVEKEEHLVCCFVSAEFVLKATNEDSALSLVEDELNELQDKIDYLKFQKADSVCIELKDNESLPVFPIKRFPLKRFRASFKGFVFNRNGNLDFVLNSIERTYPKDLHYTEEFESKSLTFVRQEKYKNLVCVEVLLELVFKADGSASAYALVQKELRKLQASVVKLSFQTVGSSIQEIKEEAIK